MSYFSQMVALIFHNFASAAVGCTVATALVRGTSRDKIASIGNFWVGLIRQRLYLYLPICLLLAVFLVSQGMIQNFSSYATATTLDTGAAQSIVQGSVASQVAIKMLGTNGGGFMNANASHPYENPTPLSNFLQRLAIFAIPRSLTYYLGRMVKNQKHSWSVWSAMFMLFLAGAAGVLVGRIAGQSPILWHSALMRLIAAWKERKSGSGFSIRPCLRQLQPMHRAARSMRCTIPSHRWGGLVPLFNMQLGEMVFGGVGSGFYGMLILVVLVIFPASLMIDRTPEYLGKKIEAFDVKAAALAVLIPGAAPARIYCLGHNQPVGHCGLKQ